MSFLIDIQGGFLSWINHKLKISFTKSAFAIPKLSRHVLLSTVNHEI